MSELEHDRLTLWHRVARFGFRGDLVHPGTQKPAEREARLDRFLARNPGWREREEAQGVALFIARRNGARFLQD